MMIVRINTRSRFPRGQRSPSAAAGGLPSGKLGADESGLLEFFGADKPLAAITPGDADGYKLHLIGKRLAPYTVRKRLQFATHVFRAAVRRRLMVRPGRNH